MVVYMLEQCSEVGLTEDADFGKKKSSFQMKLFDLGGYVNKENSRIWGTENTVFD